MSTPTFDILEKELKEMIYVETVNCPFCNGELKYYDSVKRIVKTKYGREKYVLIRRMKCCYCKRVQREMPEFIFPYKHYEKEVIIGVVEGLITCETTGFEDYPCEMTMRRWIENIDISVLQNT